MSRGCFARLLYTVWVCARDHVGTADTKIKGASKRMRYVLRSSAKGERYFYGWKFAVDNSILLKLVDQRSACSMKFRYRNDRFEIKKSDKTIDTLRMAFSFTCPLSNWRQIISRQEDGTWTVKPISFLKQWIILQRNGATLQICISRRLY